MKSIFKAVAVVTIFSVITRTLGFFFRIFISRKLGAEGLGLFQMSCNILSIFMTLIASGLPVTTAKMVTDADPQQIGNNSYYSLYTSQVEEKIRQSVSNSSTNNKYGKIILKQGDQISVTVRNNSKTLSQSLRNVYYNIAGDDVHIIVAASSGTVAMDGSTGTI